jgi:hypothetical protein
MKRDLEKKIRLASCWGRALPDFVIIGAQKSGTTALFDTLSHHPQVLRPFTKEAHYFDNNFYKSLCTGYRFQFPLKLTFAYNRLKGYSRILTGEATPFYLFHPLVPQRMSDVLPRAKILVILREPVARTYSHYQYAVKNGNESRSFDEAIAYEVPQVEAEKEKVLKQEPFDQRFIQNNAYISRSCYHAQIKAWMKHYSREQIYISSYEYLINEPTNALKAIEQFLRIDPVLTSHHLPLSNTNDYKAIPTPTYHRLKAYFKPLNEALFKEIGFSLMWD